MKALSIKEPWASMILRGEKTVEVRTWRTNYRGDILVCASAKPKTENSGNALCIVEIVDCRPMKKSDAKLSGGYFEPKSYSWVLENIRKIKKFPVKGKLSIFNVECVVECLK
ncbi:MAG: ASCH domain-containing protein [Candidatus Aenigmarchaeota archaeon]|nr:ASCH domain-containing protein [Candidatus Aenigmarchaeota archaeon]